MKEITIILFERLGLLLVIAFVLTRLPGFKSLLYREFDLKLSFVHAGVFGLFGIAGTMAGFVIDEGMISHFDFVLSAVEKDQSVVSLSLVAVVIAGLLGGPVVGMGAGLVAGVHLIFLGGGGWLANGVVNPLTGVLAGLTARFFSQERVIAPLKALFIGVFPPILHMHLLLIFHPDGGEIVDKIGLPLVLSNSLAIAIFTAMIGIVLKEQENEAALATRKALTIAEEALPFLKMNQQAEMAAGLAHLLKERLRLAAVSVTNKQEVLAHKGLGEDHHQPGQPVFQSLAAEAIAAKEMKVATARSQIECSHKNCPFEAAIIIPITEAQDVAWLITFYFRKAHHIRPVELDLAQGLGKLISHQLNLLAAESLKLHIRDAELRNLQAQINPHFLFNTLHLIATLFREDPKQARHITVQLAQFMRFNLKLVSNPLVSLEKECEHVRAYMEIIQARFSDRLKILFHVPDTIPDTNIPPSTLQPLVENCIQHGLRIRANGGKVEVLLNQQSHHLQVIVRDNGCGFPQELVKEVTTRPLTENQNSGIGLYNVNQRLISLLGEEAKLHIKNLASGGSEVSFQIPIEVRT
ncbi:LytS/YhcK type 5TM receptor domain-containing protein [Bacillus rubiinfantis]|uniref:LytS/YhcK type 5TM receptor domain-containing protein n=1 Tax=Bacillus rubiinfantis TaxID=1499680 RepID=UPI0005AB03C3|nr:LytS/YhcK type 5TM receptor domain-containing protein [Bacillus rubiinfantis]